MYHFEIVTNTVEQAENFMESVSAEDIAIEEWWNEEKEWVCGFAVSHYLPKYLNRVADFLGIALIYVESEAQRDQKAEAIIQQIRQNREAV